LSCRSGADEGSAVNWPEHTLDFARAHSYEKLVVFVRAGNRRAQAFYRSLGFTPCGVLTRQVRIDGQYEDEIFMEMFL
jgi:RimJ/RimL family protein N-acetyltransferase